MEEPEPEPEPEPPAQLGRLPTEPEPEPDAGRALGRYMVISTATLRAGPESSSAKIGEHSKGTVIEVVQEITNGKGLTVLQTITPPSGSSHGGWLKVMTSKGRALVKPWNEPEPAAAEGRKKGRRMSLTFGMSFPTEGESPKDGNGNGNGNGKKNGGRRRMSITLGRGDSSPSPERDGHGSLASPPEFGRGSLTSHSPPEFGRRRSLGGGVGQLGRGSVSELLSATLRDHDDAPEEGVAPGLGRFTATANGVIRKSHEMDSDKLGTLQKGEEIEALDIRTVGKVARIRYAAGWVSMSSSKTGRVLLAPVKKGAGAVRTRKKPTRSKSSRPKRSRQGRPAHPLHGTKSSRGSRQRSSKKPGSPSGDAPEALMRTSMKSKSDGAGLRVSQRRSLSDRTLRVTFEEQGSLGISFAPQRADDAGGGDRIMVTAVQEGSLASIYKADGLAEGAVLLEVQGKQVEGGQFEYALTLLQQCLNVRPLTLEFRLTAHATILDLPRTESEDSELTAVPFALEHTAVAELGLKFASQLDGFGESAEHVVVIHEVAEGALTTTVHGESLTAVPGMVLNGVSGRPIAGRIFEDVMDMIANSMLVASLVEKAEAPAQTNLAPESPALPHRTPQGDLVRPAPPLPHRAWDGSLTSASAGACVLEFDALLNKSGKLEPRVLPRLLSIQLMSSEPARVLFAEVPRPDAADENANTGAMVVVHQLDYGSEAIVELAEAGLCEGMVLRAVNDTPVHGAGAAKSESEDDTPPYTVHEVEEVLKMGPRPLTLSFEGEFDEETAQLLPRLVSVPVSADSQLLFASQTGGMVQRTFEVKRGSLSKGIHLRLGDMAIQVEARNGGWQSFLYEKLDRVEVRGRKLVIRMQGTAGAPTVLRCQGDDAREIAKDVETKIRQLRAASRASSLVALRSSGGRDSLPQVAEGVETEAEADVSPRVSPQVGPFSGGAAVEPLKLEPADPEPGSAPATPEKTLANTPLARQPSSDGGTPGATPRTLDALLMKAQAKHNTGGDETQRKRATSEISEASSSAPSSPRAGSEASEEPVSPHPAEGVPKESVWATVADMKSLYEVPQLEQSALFAKKMRLCTCAEGAEGVPAAVVSACQLEMMKDLKDFVLVKGVFSSQDSPDLFELGLDLIATRLIRPVAPVEEDFFDVDESLDDEDEEEDDEGGTPVAGSRAAVTVRTDPEWPMLLLVYEFACRMLTSSDVPTAKAAISLSRHESEGGGSCSGRRLLTQLVPLLEDAGQEERQWIIKLLKLLVSRFGRTKLRRVVKILLEACGNACLTLAYDSAVQRHRGLAEVLDLAQALIEQWRPPMLEYQAAFIIRSLGALHTLPVDNISPCHEVLKECQFAAIEKDEAYPLPLPVVQNLLKMWPRQNTEKEELFLEELEGLLAFLAPTDIMVVGKQLAARLVSSLCSPHVEVMKGALYLLVSEDVDAVLADTAAAVGAGEGGERERAVVETMFQKLTGAAPVNDPKRRFNEEVMELTQDVREALARHRLDCLGEDDDDEFYQ